LLLRISGKQEQIMLYLYEFRNTPERGVGPDPRLTAQRIAGGTQLQVDDAIKQLNKLSRTAFVRAVPLGEETFHYLTKKGYDYVERVQSKTVKAGVAAGGVSFGIERDEVKGRK
jgi:hypothetical protein